MTDVIPHFCTGVGCEPLHGSRQSEAVQVARIQADRDVEVARISHAETRAYTEAATEQAEIQAEAQIAEAVITAEAATEQAVVENEVLEEIVNPEPEPVAAPIVVAAADPDGDDDMTPPEVEHESSKKAGSGFWAGYSAT